MAFSVSFPIAIISIAKALLFTCGLLYIVGNIRSNHEDSRLGQLWTTRIAVISMFTFMLSLMWTEADLEGALTVLVKHGKIMSIVLLAALIRNASEARIAIMAYAAGQLCLLLSSWLMFLGFDLPWRMGAPTPYVVFSSHLDQSVIFAVAANVAWHLQRDHLWPTWLGIGFAVLALVNVLLLLEGRSGYAIAVTSISLAIMWALPRRLRFTTLVVTPIVVIAALAFGSDQVQQRVTKLFDESKNFAQTQQVKERDSSAWRLNAWYRSAQAIAERPLVGYGVGAFSPAVRQLQGAEALRIFGEGSQSNPHQEFLLWTVELGLGGLLLLLLFMFCIARDAMRFPTNIRRATLSVLGAVIVVCLFNSALLDDLMGDFLCVSLGLLIALGMRTESESSQIGKTNGPQIEAPSPV
jgi:O-antigen ligase